MRSDDSRARGSRTLLACGYNGRLDSTTSSASHAQCGALDVGAHAVLLGLGEMQSGFRAAPEHVIRVPSPLVAAEVIDFAGVEIRAEVLAQVLRMSCETQYIGRERSVSAGDACK